MQSPVSSSALSPSPNSYTSQNPGSNSLASDVYEPYQNLSSPGSVEVSSDIVVKNNGTDSTVDYTSPAQVSQALKRLEEQLSLNEDSFKEMSPFCGLDGDTDDSKFLEYGKGIAKQEPDILYESDDIVQGHLYFQPARVENHSNSFALLPDGGSLVCHFFGAQNYHNRRTVLIFYPPYLLGHYFLHLYVCLSVSPHTHTHTTEF